MSFEVKIMPEVFLKAVKKLAKVAPRNASLEILSHTLLKAEGDTLMASATDFEVYFDLDVSAGSKIISPGEVVVPVQLLDQTLARCKDDVVTLKFIVDTYKLQVIGSKAIEAELNCMNPEEFPLLFDLETSDVEFECSVDEFRLMFEPVTFSAAADESRPVFMGVLTQFDLGQITTVTADGYRLAYNEVGIAQATAQDPLLLPATAIDKFLQMLPKKGEELEIPIEWQRLLKTEKRLEGTEVRVDRVRFITDGMTFVVTNIFGDYPDYNQIIPTGHDTRAVVPKTMINSVMLSGVFSNGVKLIQISVDQEKVVVFADSADRGRAQDEREVIEFEGEPLTIGVNHTYIKDVLEHIITDNVEFWLRGPGSPILIMPRADAVKPKQKYVVMPMHVSR